MTEPILTIDQALPAPAERDEDLGTQYAESQSLTRAEMAQKTIDEFMAEQASGKPAGRVTSESGVPPASAGIGETVKSGAKAVASAIPQIPTQVAGGVVDAFKETVQAIEDVSEFALHGVMGGDEVERIMERSRKLSPLQVAAGALPDIKQPRGTGGAVVREGAKFMAAFVPLVGQFSKARAALKLTGTATRITADMAAGAIADFLVTDPAEGLLESLVESNPEIQGPVDEFFTNAEDDPAIVNRLKNSLVGAGFGLVADGMIVGMRALRSARRAKVALKAEKKKAAEKQARALGGEPELPTGAASLGDVAAPRAARRSSTKEKMAAAEKRIEEKFPPGTLSREEITRRAALEETSIEVNLERIDGPEDVKALYQEVTDLFSDSISEARRGVRSNELTQEAADRLGLSVDDVLRRRKGKPLNAVESVAFRKIWDDAARQVTELASAANGPTAGPTDLFKFRQALVKFQAITEEVLGARAETARALQSWNIKTGGATEQGRALNQLIEASGGAGTTEALAKRISIASAGGATPGQLSVMMRKGAVARTIEAVQESFVLGLLWTPSTHMVNLASNSIVAAQQILERGVASRIAANRGAVDSVVPGEALAMMHGLVSGMRDMFGVAAQESLARTTI